jgi:predicted  nucleic acid-binding Zn-ribbon protein
MTPALHPDIQRLTDANDLLRTELAALLTQAHDLTHTVRPNLLAFYQSKLGAWELEKLKAQFRVARLKRTIELVQAALNRGGKPDMIQIEAQVQEEQVLWEKKIQEAAAKLQQAEERLSHLLSDEHNAELKKLYHQLVKQLHPDLNPDQDHGTRQMWQQVQEAYDMGDLEKLRALSLLLHEPPKPADTPDALEKLQTEHAMLEKRIAELKQKITALESQPPFTLREDLDNEVWISMRRTALEKETEPLQAQAAALEKHLESLVPPPHVPGIQFGPN